MAFSAGERVFEAGGRVYKDAISRWPKRFVLSAMGLASATTGAIALQTLGIYDFGFAWMDAEMPTCRKVHVFARRSGPDAGIGVHQRFVGRADFGDVQRQLGKKLGYMQGEKLHAEGIP
ncbi:hypothetical protein DIPPA_18762 [Diplonema papillatum]|nr:hypothetical protein DIPPA_18762 [Diplonema papillatum]